jgi:hypothetical protein
LGATEIATMFENRDYEPHSTTTDTVSTTEWIRPTPTSYNPYPDTTTAAYIYPTTPLSGNSATVVQHGSSPTTTPPMNTPPPPDGGLLNPWGHMGGFAHNAIIVCAIIGVMAIIFCCAWFCCGCCGLRKRRRQRQRPPLPHAASSRDAILPMHTIPSPTSPNRARTQNRLSSRLHNNRFSRSLHTPYSHGGAAGGPGGDAPPSYEEIVPPQHVRLAGGVRREPEVEAEDGMVADGKTPLSEIPFEDVVLDHTMSASSESSARGFAAQNHARWGDTTGHTNS